MLCQALWTALAVTCTLSRTHALDLMCVLILSGIQKEDLDVSMLQKLQRHNVNINDMNNEELRRKCKGLDLNSVKTNHTTTEIYSAKDKSNARTDKSLKKNLVTGDIFQRQVYLDPIQGKENYEPETNTEKISKTQTVLNEETMNKGDIEYNDRTPKLESVLNFWNKFVKVNKRDSIARTPSSPNIFIGDKSSEGSEPKNKRDVRNENNTNESYIINKMINNFLMQKKNLITDRPSTQGFIFDNIFDSQSPNDGFEKRYKEDSMKNKYNIGNTLEQIETKHYVNGEPRSIFADMETDEVTTNNPYMSFKDMLAAIEQKTAFPFQDSGPKNYNQYRNIEHDTPNKVVNDFNLDSLLNPKEILPNKNPEKGSSPSFSRDVIQDIAESVKALVLKDLRNVVREPTTQTATTILTTSQKYTLTTEKGTTQSVSKADDTLQESVLSKFMELFDQVKSLKNNPVIITRDIQNTMEEEKLKDSVKNISVKSPIQNNGDDKVNIPKLVLTTSLHNTIQQPYVITPIFKPISSSNLGPTYDFEPQVHKFRSNPAVLTEKTPDKSYVLNKKSVPITFQTNALEIPPLGVYLDRPHDPINQNIIVTTPSPQRVGRKERYTAYSSAVDIQNAANFNKVNTFIPKPNTYCSTHDCTRIQKSKSHHNPKSSSSNDDRYTNHKRNLNRFMTYTDPVHEEKQYNVPRYYERLEKMDEELSKKNIYVDCCEEKYLSSQQISDCCNRKIASRQQISLNPMKRGYDDTHFKNFLKSQQKVTDMLERILAVKNKLRSVENI